MKHLFRYRCDRNLSKLAEKMPQNVLKGERVSLVYCQFLPSPIIAFIFLFLTDQKISHDVCIPCENFGNHHILFTVPNPDRLVLCSQQQQQRQNKCKPSKFICAFFPNFSSEYMFIAELSVKKDFSKQSKVKLKDSLINKTSRKLQ